MNREELLAALQELSDRRHGAAGWKPIYVIEQEILAKFKAEADKAESWARGLGEAQAELEQQKSKAESWARGLAHWRNKCIEAQVENEKLSTKVATLQSQLDFALSEPYHYSRDKAEYPWIRHEGKADGCPICNPKPSENKELHARVWASERSQPLERRCYVGGRWILLQDCRVCNPKPSEKPARCPECHETKYINRVVAVADWELHPIYVIATCLNCKGEGVI